MSIDIRNGNCLELMKSLPDASIDLMICDLPYGETNCKWDSCIDLNEFWTEFKRIRRSPKTACIHFCSTKFGYKLIESNPKLYKMDLVWKKRNKTGGLQSRHRPMRNHEMVYFFYEKAPKYNRDKYHKRIRATKPMNKKGDYTYGNSSDVNTQGTNSFEPPNPPSIIEDDQVYSKKGWETGAEFGSKEYREKLKQEGKSMSFEPVQPGSVIDTVYGEANGGDGFGGKEYRKKLEEKGEKVVGFTPVQPASVVEAGEKNKVWGYDKPDDMDEFKGNAFEPKLPTSILDTTDEDYKNEMKKGDENSAGYKKQMGGFFKDSLCYEPRQPVSIIDNDNELDVFDFIENPEEAPFSVFESKKCFVGKRNHQTEKPLDILEFFLKYWSDENDTVLDPTMGSGSTGVACAKMNRNFIGFELNETIFKKAEKRIKEKK